MNSVHFLFGDFETGFNKRKIKLIVSLKLRDILKLVYIIV